MSLLDEYAEWHAPSTVILDELAEITNGLEDWSIMRVSNSEGAFLSMLAGLIKAKTIVELGTFTGYATLWLAQNDASIFTCDTSKTWTDIGQKFWKKAGVQDRIELFVGPAIEFLETLPATIDFSFIDADKENYLTYYEALLKRTRVGGLIVIDDTLWFGEVVNPNSPFPETESIKAFNSHISSDPRVEAVLLNIRNGLTVCRKKES